MAARARRSPLAAVDALTEQDISRVASSGTGRLLALPRRLDGALWRFRGLFNGLPAGAVALGHGVTFAAPLRAGLIDNPVDPSRVYRGNVRANRPVLPPSQRDDVRLWLATSPLPRNHPQIFRIGRMRGPGERWKTTL